MVTHYLPSSSGYYSTNNTYTVYQIKVVENGDNTITCSLVAWKTAGGTESSSASGNVKWYIDDVLKETVEWESYGVTIPAATTSSAGSSVTFGTSSNLDVSGKSSATIKVVFYMNNSIGTNTNSETIALTASTYVITYNANGGSGAPGSQTVTIGETLVLSSEIPIRDGYDFVGWDESSSATSASYFAGHDYTFTSSTTLYAVWEIAKYYINYDANGGSNAPSVQTKTHDISLVISSDEPDRVGYTFLGWSTSNTSSAINYHPNDTYTANEDMSLYAVWQANTYTLTLDYNDANYNNQELLLTYDADTYSSLSEFTPIRGGYKFLGWYTDLTDGTLVYDKNGLCINNKIYWSNNQCVYANDYTVYPHWKSLNVAYTKVDGAACLCHTFIKQDGAWNELVIYQKLNGVYCHNDEDIRFFNDGVVEAFNFIEQDTVNNHFENAGEIIATEFIEHDSSTYYFEDGALYAKQFKET